MTPPNPFDHAPDERLGQLLRAHLAPPEDAAFTARVLARLGAREDSSLDVLARWARAGIAAALILALAATAAARASATATAVADDGLLPSAETMLASATSTR
jgi:GNAT superfamily N-acetyltransferase